MRFITTFGTIICILLLLGIASFFIARETFLYWGVSSFKDSLKHLEAESLNSTYATQCSTQGTGFIDAIQLQTQLRFTSNTEYVIEATCDEFSSRPILISKNHLPPFITKVPGTSGVIWGGARSAVQLQVFSDLVRQIKDIAKLDLSFLEKKAIIGVEGKEITQFTSDEREFGRGPVTSCEGYGFSCCQIETEVGVGEHINGLTECSQTCFSSCSSRPVVLSFNSNPFIEARTRTARSANGGSVDFSYVVDAPGASSIQVTIDFGDGSTPALLNTEEGNTTHRYTCPRESCTYQAKISVVDNWQVYSYDAALNTITVLVE